MFVMKRPRFSTRSRVLALLPRGDADLAAKHAGFDADVGDWLGQAESAAPGLAVFAGLGRGGEGHVAIALFLRAALVNRGEGEASGQAAGGGAGIDPGEFEGDQGEREVLRPFDEAALRGIHEDSGDSGFIEGVEQGRFLRGPLVGVAGAGGHQAGDRSARHGADTLHQHLQVVTVGEAPEDLPDIIAGQGA